MRRKAKAMSDINRSMPLFNESEKVLIFTEYWLNCLTINDGPHAREHEVRLLIAGEVTKLAP